jgi:hypothetical protein
MRIRMNHPNRFESLFIYDDQHGGLVLEPIPVIEKCPSCYIIHQTDRFALLAS